LEFLAQSWNLLPSLPRTLVAFALVLGVLVFIHEMGHYLAARWRGVHVDAFSIGFGRPLWRRTDRRGTEWRLGWLPLGGYVKLHGLEVPEETDAATRASWRPGQTFHDKPVADRAIVVAAGPFANYLLAVLLFAALAMTVGRPAGNTTIGMVVEGSAAERGGLRVGDEIVSLDGERVARFEQVQRHVQPRAGRPIEMRVARDGEERTLTVTPDSREGGPQGAATGVLGIQGGAVRLERLSLGPALADGVSRAVDVTWQSLTSIGEMLVGQRSARDLGGPIRIAEISGEAASLGPAALVSLMALLSVSLGLLNLFPVPLLDGGHLVFYALEAIRGRPLPPRAQEYGYRAGFALLATLFVLVSWNDIVHGTIGKFVARLVG
jgi:regulator of sigma E protease